MRARGSGPLGRRRACSLQCGERHALCKTPDHGGCYMYPHEVRAQKTRCGGSGGHGDVQVSLQPEEARALKQGVLVGRCRLGRALGRGSSAAMNGSSEAASRRVTYEGKASSAKRCSSLVSFSAPAAQGAPCASGRKGAYGVPIKCRARHECRRCGDGKVRRPTQCVCRAGRRARITL